MHALRYATANGNISVRPSEDSQIRVSGKKKAKAWNESDANNLRSAPVSRSAQNGDGYEIRPMGVSAGDSRISIDLGSGRSEKGFADDPEREGRHHCGGPWQDLSCDEWRWRHRGSWHRRDVNIDTRKSDIKVSDTKGNIKISGHGGESMCRPATGG